MLRKRQHGGTHPGRRTPERGAAATPLKRGWPTHPEVIYLELYSPEYDFFFIEPFGAEYQTHGGDQEQGQIDQHQHRYRDIA